MSDFGLFCGAIGLILGGLIAAFTVVTTPGRLGGGRWALLAACFAVMAIGVVGTITILRGQTAWFTQYPQEAALWMLVVWIGLIAWAYIVLRPPGSSWRQRLIAARGLLGHRGSRENSKATRSRDAVQVEVQRAPTNPMVPFVAFDTEGRTEYGVPLQGGRPRTLRFELPVEKTVREKKLPVVLSWGAGKKLEILRFYDGGVTVNEINTRGDTVKFVPYYRPRTPVALDTTTSTRAMTLDANIAPPPDKPFVDFMDSPDEPMFAKVWDFTARMNEGRQVRAEIRAFDSLSKSSDAPVRQAAVEQYAKFLYDRNDTTLDVSEEQTKAWLAWKNPDAAAEADGQKVVPLAGPFGQEQTVIPERSLLDRDVRAFLAVNGGDAVWTKEPILLTDRAEKLVGRAIALGMDIQPPATDEGNQLQSDYLATLRQIRERLADG